MWSLLEKQGILQQWFDEGLLVTRKNTTFWTPKALEILGLQESIGGVNLSDQKGGKPRKVQIELPDDWIQNFASKFSAKAIAVSGKGGNIAIMKV